MIDGQDLALDAYEEAILEELLAAQAALVPAGAAVASAPRSTETAGKPAGKRPPTAAPRSLRQPARRRSRRWGQAASVLVAAGAAAAVVATLAVPGGHHRTTSILPAGSPASLAPSTSVSPTTVAPTTAVPTTASPITMPPTAAPPTTVAPSIPTLPPLTSATTVPSTTIPSSPTTFVVPGYSASAAQTALASCLAGMGPSSDTADYTLRAAFADSYGTELVITTATGAGDCAISPTGTVLQSLLINPYAAVEGWGTKPPASEDATAMWLTSPVELDWEGSGIVTLPQGTGWLWIVEGRVAAGIAQVKVEDPNGVHFTAPVQNGFFVARQLLPSPTAGPGTTEVQGFDASGALVYQSPPPPSSPSSIPCFVTPSGEPVTPAAPNATCETATPWSGSVSTHGIPDSGGSQKRAGVPTTKTANSGNTPAEPATHIAPAFAPSTQLVTIGTSKLQIISAANGKVARTVDLRPPLPQPPSETASVDPAGHTAYVAVAIAAGCESSKVVAIDLRSGHDRVVATSASDPAVSPDGTRLAYVDACGVTTPVAPVPEVTVETLRGGSSRSWIVLPPQDQPSKASGLPSESVDSLAWAPNGRRLVIGSFDGPASGVQILDTTSPAGARNPEAVGPYTASRGLPPGRYQDPTLLPDGTVAALSPLCWGGMSCSPDPHAGGELVTIDPTTAKVKQTIVSSTADAGDQLAALALDASRQRLAMEVFPSSGQATLEVDSAGRFHAVATGAPAFAWLPLELGKVTGTLRIVGGPAPGIDNPEPGRVEIVSTEKGPGQRQRQTVSVSTNGRFSFTIPAGSYELSGSSPNIDQGAGRCTALGPVQVVARRTIHANVVCNVP